MSQSVVQGDLLVNGTLYASSVVPSGVGITNAGISANAAIAATKLKHQYEPVYAQPNGTAATTVRQVIHVAFTAQFFNHFHAGVVTACVGAATISIQVKVNGTNRLTSAIVLDNTNASFVPENYPGVTSTTLNVNDVVEVDITATAGGGTLGQGLFCQLVAFDT